LGLEIADVLRSLAQERRLFHSEADFQHALAWEIHRRLPDAEVRLEVPLSTLRERLDLLVRTKNGATYGFELKYKTQAVTCGLAGEAFEVRNHGAPDSRAIRFFERRYAVGAICCSTELDWLRPSSVKRSMLLDPTESQPANIGLGVPSA